jgi:hypothetical protein
MPKGKTDIWNHFSLHKSTKCRDKCAFCNFCNQSFKVNATRMRKHLVRDCNKCPKVIKVLYADQVACSSFKLKSDVVDRKPSTSTSQSNSEFPAVEVNNIIDINEDSIPSTSSMVPISVSGTRVHNQRTQNTELVVSEPQPADVTSSADMKIKTIMQRRQVTLYSFADTMSTSDQNELDVCFAKAVYATASPLSMAENQHWLEFFKKLRPSWTVPSRYEMSNRLLDDWVHKVEVANHKKIAGATTLAIMSDGWSCVSGDSHIQFLVSTPEPIFLKSVHPKAKSHTAEFIFDEVCKIMEGVEGEKSILDRPPTDVSAFCTDNASNMKSAWQLLKAKYPWLFCYGCTAHSLNLLAGDFSKISTVKTTLHENRSVSRFFREHQIPKSVLQEKTITTNGKPLTCIIGVATRWSTDYCMVKRNIDLKQALMHCTLDSRCLKAFSSKKIEKALILDEDGFWTRSRLVAQLLKPVKDAISEVEGDVVPVSIIPRLWKVLKCRVTKAAQGLVNTSAISTDDMAQLLTFVDYREEFCLHPAHMAANIIDPRFMGGDLTDEQVSSAESVILEVASRCGISDIDCLDDLSNFRARQGLVYSADTRSHIWKHASSFDLEPLTWWSSYAPSRPLGTIAKTLLVLPATIAAVERTNKAFSQQKTKHRNRLSDSRSTDLTMVAYNLQSSAARKKIAYGDSSKKLHNALVMPDCSEHSTTVEDNDRLMFIHINLYSSFKTIHVAMNIIF